MQPLTELYNAERRSLARTVARISGESDAEDFVHDAFLAYIAAGASHPAPAAWLTRVARNRALNRVQRSREIPVAETPAAEDGADPGASVDAEALREMISQAFDSLSARSREALRLRFYEDLEYPEIAAALGVRVPVARTIVHRSVKRLGRALLALMAPAHGSCSLPACARLARTARNSCAACFSAAEELASWRAIHGIAAVLPLAAVRVRRVIERLWSLPALAVEPTAQVAAVLAAITLSAGSVATAVRDPIPPAPPLQRVGAPSQITDSLVPTKHVSARVEAASRVSGSAPQAGESPAPEPSPTPQTVKVETSQGRAEVEPKDSGLRGRVEACVKCPP